MDDKTILRTEEKYLISKSEKTSLLHAIEKRLAHDEFYQEEVLSLYYDTPNFDLVIKSIDRPDFREKIRVRAYDVPKLSSKVFFEVKSKYAVGKKKLGNKRRLVLPLKSFYAYEKGKTSLESLAADVSKGDLQQVQIARELDYLMRIYALEPKILISSDRVAFVAKDNPDFRLTFDEHLRFRTDKLRLEKGSAGEEYFPHTTLDDPKKNVIMEVKTMHAMPPWFVAELSRRKIYPATFSKYGKIYQLIKERNQHV